MKKIAFLAIAASMLPVAAGARPQPMCAPHGELVEALETKHGETPVAGGLTVNGQFMEIFVGPTNEWTLVATHPDGTSCVVMIGSHFISAPPTKPSAPADPA